MTYDPFKCPDCGVWWRGETHKCIVAKPNADFQRKGTDYPRKGWISCPICGKNVTKYDWHSCNDWHKPNKKDPHDPNHPPIRYS